MKRCPKCSQTYTDETLNFCLDDGQWLREVSEANQTATVILPSEAQTRIHAAEASSPVEVVPTASVSRKANKTSVLAVVGALLIAVLGVGGYWLYSGRTSKQIDSIAVMPFVNESGNSDLDYLSDGMTETLINALMQLPNLNVQARSSVFRYKGKEVDAPTLGRALNVQAILNGRVVQRNDGLTLYLELVDAVTGNRIWGERYDRQQSDLVSLQRETARDVASKLQAKLTSSDQQKLARNYTENAEAYRLYILGRYFWNKQTNKDVEKSVEYFQNAIAIDPNYALAYAGLADAYSLNVAGSNRERMAKAKEAALKAISLDDNLAEAHASVARPLATNDYDFAGAERELRRAIELNPNYGTAHHFLADLLSVLGRYDEAFPEHQRALELEPFSAVFTSSYGRSLIRVRRYDEAVAQSNRALELDPNFRGAHGNLGLVYELTGKYAESIDMRAKVYELNGDAQTARLIRESFAKRGLEGYNRYLISENRPKTLPFYTMAVAYTSLGEKEKAFDALNKGAENHEITMHQFLKSDPRIDPLRNDPRFHDLMKRVGFEK